MTTRYPLLRAALLALAWSAAPPPAGAQSPADDAADSAIFRAVVTELAGSAQGALLVDARSVNAGADLTSVEPGEVGQPFAGREQVLRRMGIASTEFLVDQRCLFAHGLPPAPEFDPLGEAERAIRQQCRQRAPFTSAIVGDARREGGTATVAVARMTTSSYIVREYVLRDCGRGGWRIVSTRDVIAVQS